MPADICRILEETSLKLTPNKSNITGVGRVDALAAINAVEPDDAIEENEIAENGFSIYPIPSFDVLFVLSENINSDYRIINILGETVMSGKIASENQQIDVSELPEGMYFITIGNMTNKFLKK